MTNAAHEPATAPAALDYVGVDMAKQTFAWGLYGERRTHSANNTEEGFQAPSWA